MNVGRLKKILEQFPDDANARAYEGEVCGLIIEEAGEGFTPIIAVIYAHESEDEESPDFVPGCEPPEQQ